MNSTLFIPLVYLTSKLNCSFSDVKAWDTRYTYKVGSEAKPIAIYPNIYSSRSFTQLAITKRYIFVACLNHHVYRFDKNNPSRALSYTADGFQLKSFHVQVVADEKHLVCGSSNGGVYVWRIDHPEWPPYILRSNVHEEIEIGCVILKQNEIICGTDGAEVQRWLPVILDSVDKDPLKSECRGHSSIKWPVALVPTKGPGVNLEYLPPLEPTFKYEASLEGDKENVPSVSRISLGSSNFGSPIRFDRQSSSKKATVSSRKLFFNATPVHFKTTSKQ